MQPTNREFPRAKGVRGSFATSDYYGADTRKPGKTAELQFLLHALLSTRNCRWPASDAHHLCRPVTDWRN